MDGPLFALLIIVCIVVLGLWAATRRPEGYMAGAADSALFNRCREKLLVAIRSNQTRFPYCTLNMMQPWHLDNDCADKCLGLQRVLRTIDVIEDSVSGTERTKAIPFELVLSDHRLNYAVIPTHVYLRNLEAWVAEMAAGKAWRPLIAVTNDDVDGRPSGGYQ